MKLWHNLKQEILSRNNCFTFAMYRFITQGGYVSMMKSHVGWWPHFKWSKDLVTFEDWIPLKYERGLLIPPIIFKGRIRVEVPGKRDSL